MKTICTILAACLFASSGIIVWQAHRYAQLIAQAEDLRQKMIADLKQGAETSPSEPQKISAPELAAAEGERQKVTAEIKEESHDPVAPVAGHPDIVSIDPSLLPREEEIKTERLESSQNKEVRWRKTETRDGIESVTEMTLSPSWISFEVPRAESSRWSPKQFDFVRAHSSCASFREILTKYLEWEHVARINKVSSFIKPIGTLLTKEIDFSWENDGAERQAHLVGMGKGDETEFIPRFSDAEIRLMLSFLSDERPLKEIAEIEAKTAEEAKLFK